MKLFEPADYSCRQTVYVTNQYQKTTGVGTYGGSTSTSTITTISTTTVAPTPTKLAEFSHFGREKEFEYTGSAEGEINSAVGCLALLGSNKLISFLAPPARCHRSFPLQPTFGSGDFSVTMRLKKLENQECNETAEINNLETLIRSTTKAIACNQRFHIATTTNAKTRTLLRKEAAFGASDGLSIALDIREQGAGPSALQPVPFQPAFTFNVSGVTTSCPLQLKDPDSIWSVNSSKTLKFVRRGTRLAIFVDGKLMTSCSDSVPDDPTDTAANNSNFSNPATLLEFGAGNDDQDAKLNLEISDITICSHNGCDSIQDWESNTEVCNISSFEDAAADVDDASVDVGITIDEGIANADVCPPVYTTTLTSKFRTCEAYCADKGLFCAGAWEESVGSHCTPSFRMANCSLPVAPSGIEGFEGLRGLASTNGICQCSLAENPTFYSIGDRVEVWCSTKVFDANVTHVHSTGKVNVKFDIDGSVLEFLTAEKHGLKLVLPTSTSTSNPLAASDSDGNTNVCGSTSTPAPFDGATNNGSGRRRGRWAALAVVIILLAIGAAILIVQRRRQQQQQQQQEELGMVLQSNTSSGGLFDCFFHNTRQTKLERDLCTAAKERAALAFLATYNRNLFASVESVEDFHSRLNQLEIPRAQLKPKSVLGTGNYGQVKLASLVGGSIGSSSTGNGGEGRPGAAGDTSTLSLARLVAVKSRLPAEVDATVDEALLIEALVLHSLRHKHVLGLVGICTTALPFLVATELMVNGDLKSFLRGSRPSQPKPKALICLLDVIVIIERVASALSHLEAVQVIHRDVAARNVLVGSVVTDVKLGDLGAARSVFRLADREYTATSDHNPRTVDGARMLEEGNVQQQERCVGLCGARMGNIYVGENTLRCSRRTRHVAKHRRGEST